MSTTRRVHEALNTLSLYYRSESVLQAVTFFENACLLQFTNIVAPIPTTITTRSLHQYPFVTYTSLIPYLCRHVERRQRRSCRVDAPRADCELEPSTDYRGCEPSSPRGHRMYHRHVCYAQACAMGPLIGSSSNKTPAVQRRDRTGQGIISTGEQEEAVPSRWGLRGKKGKSMQDNPLMSAFARLRNDLKGCKGGNSCWEYGSTMLMQYRHQNL
jgi:hypothetical protein